MIPATRLFNSMQLLIIQQSDRLIRFFGIVSNQNNRQIHLQQLKELEMCDLLV